MLSWESLYRGLDPLIAGYLFQSRVLANLYKSCYYSAAGIILLFTIINLLLAKAGPGHLCKLRDSARVICSTHIAFFTIFLATTVPFSIAMVRVLFTSGGLAYLGDTTTYLSVAYPLALMLAMYGAEGAFRAVSHVNVFLIVHHLMFCSLVVLAFEGESPFVLKVSVIVSCFATYEVLLYAALIARKMQAPTMVVKAIMAGGLGFYGFTRVLQLVLLIGLFAGGYSYQHETSKGTALWWTSLGMSILLVVLQLYTFVIYRAIWKRLGQSVSKPQLEPRESAAQRQIHAFTSISKEDSQTLAAVYQLDTQTLAGVNLLASV